MVDKYQVMPEPRPEEYEALKADILRRGIQSPIIEDEDGNILDGHTRLRAYQELKDEGHKLPPYPRTVRSDLGDDVAKRTAARKENSLRRHLTTRQKMQILREQLIDTPQFQNSVIARWIGLHRTTVQLMRRNMEQEGQIPFIDYLLNEEGKRDAHVPSRSKRRNNPTGAVKARLEAKKERTSQPSLGQTLRSAGPIPGDELPSGQLAEEQEAFYAVSRYLNALSALDPKEIAASAASIDEAATELENANHLIEWFGAYRDALKDKAHGRLRAV